MNISSSFNKKGNNNTKAWDAKPNENNPKPQNGNIKTYNLMIVDESGSMSSIYDAAFNGMNETIDAILRAAKDHPEQEQFLTLVTFNSSRYNEILSALPASKLRHLTPRQYRPNDCTPLYDAMGRAISELENRIEQGDAVLVTVITDGYENASSEYTGQEIKKMVERLSEKGWLFTYIGANQDSRKVSASIGIKNSLDFDYNEEGAKNMFAKELRARGKFYESRSSMSEEDICACENYFED